MNGPLYHCYTWTPQGRELYLYYDDNRVRDYARSRSTFASTPDGPPLLGIGCNIVIIALQVIFDLALLYMLLRAIGVVHE